jgi:hypothetical protein
MSKLAARRKVRLQAETTTRTELDTPASPFNPETPSPAPTITQAEITARAYHLFLARGGNHGDDQADWFRAEAELRRERGIEKATPSGND